MFRDLRFALREFRKHPAFTCTALLTLALGIGANTAVYSIIDGVLLHPLPFPDSDRLVAIYQKGALADKNSVSYPNLLDWQRMNRNFDGIAGWRTDGFALTAGGPPEPVMGLMVSANFFSILRVQPLIGRTFSEEEDRRGGRPVVLLGENFWKRRFASDPNIAGATITLDGKNYDVIGVIPATVRLSQSLDSYVNDVFVPIGQRDAPLFYNRGTGDGTIGLARLKPAVSLSEAQAEMNTIMGNLVKEYPDENSGVGVNAVAYEEDVVGNLRLPLLALSAAVGFVLLIACTNVANLVLARSAHRSQEFGIRLALGIGNGRLVRQIFTEGAALSLCAGFAGVAIASYGTSLALALLPSLLPPMAEIGINARVLLFSLGISLLTAVLFGFFPVLKVTRLTPQETLRMGGRGLVCVQHRAQRFLIVTELSLTLVLLAGSGLMIRSFLNVWQVNPGFDPENLLTFYTRITPASASTPEEIRSAVVQLGDRLASVPGVESASIQVGGLPFLGNTTISFSTEEDDPQSQRRAELRTATFYAVGADHFKTMRIPLLRGRPFTRQDIATSPLVTIIDEELARTAFPGQDALGRYIRAGLFDRRPAEIVGIAGHVTHAGLDLDLTARIRSQFYFPAAQLPDVILPLVNAVAGIVRLGAPPATVLASIRNEVAALDSGGVVANAQLMTDAIRISLSGRRFSLLVLGSFAAIALILSFVGIYGVLSYFVAQRTSEFGLRMALGAQPEGILYHVLSAGGKLAALGIAIGLVVAAGLTRLMRSLLFGISSTDLVAFALAALLLFAAALLACYVPARRATRIDPMTALREQ